MAVSVSATWQAVLTVIETLDSTSVPGAPLSTRKVVHSDFNGGGVIDANTTVPATKCAVFTKAMTAGAATIDLTSLTHNGQSVTFDGLKVQAVILKNPVGNSAIRVKSGASNGYAFGDTSGSTFDAYIAAGGYMVFYTPDLADDVSSTVKNVDISGTTTQSLYIGLVAG